MSSTNNQKTTLIVDNHNLDSTGNQEIDLLERAKIAYRQTMPEILGGGYPVQPGIIRGQNESSTKIVEEPATKPVFDRLKDQLGLTTEKVKYPVEAGIIKDGSSSKQTKPQLNHGKERLHELEDELWKAPVAHSIELTQEGIKEVLKAPSTDRQSSIKSDEGAKAHLEQAKDEMKMAFATAKPHLAQAASHVKEAGSQTMTQVKEAVIEGIAQIKGVSKEGNESEKIEKTPVQAEDIDKKTMIQEAKDKIKETVQGAKNKISEVSSEEKPRLKQTSSGKEEPHVEHTNSVKEKLEEKLEAGVEKAKEKLEERKEENLKQKPLLEQAKIRYRETMPEILGGRPSSVPEVIGMVKKYENYADHQKEEAKNFEQLPPEEQSTLAKLKYNYKEKMPVVLGGRPTPLHEVVEGAVKNKVDNVKKDTQEEVDNLKESYENGNLGEHLKELYKDKMPEALGGRTPAPPTFGEKVKAEVQKEVGAVGKAVVKNRVNAVISGTKEQIAHTLG